MARISKKLLKDFDRGLGSLVGMILRREVKEYPDRTEYLKEHGEESNDENEQE